MSAFNSAGTGQYPSATFSPISTSRRMSNFGTLGNITGKTITTKTETKSRKAPTIKTYKSIYMKVFHNRMKFYHRLSAVLALATTLLLYLPSKSSAFSFPLKLILLWTGYFVLQQARVSAITTESSTASNIIQKTISILCSRKFYILGGSFLFNNFIVSLILYMQSDSSLNYYIETPTKTIKPFVNDNFSFLCFFTLATSVIYSVNFMISEKFTLHIPMGTYRQEPIGYLTNLPLLKILILSVLKSILAFFLTPLIYHIVFRDIFFKTFLRPLVFLYDLNNQLPRPDFNIGIIFKLSFYLWMEVLSYDLLNEFFNAYALIGCLVVKKPISHFSNTPFQTLMSGIKDYKNPIVRLTAYQELVYLSTSSDFKDRQTFYRADNWNLILAEFFFVQTNAARSARSDLPKVESNDVLRKERIQNMKKQASIFGNLNRHENRLDFDSDFKAKEKSDKNENNEDDVTVIKNDNDAIFTKPEPKAEQISDFELKYSIALTSLYTSLTQLKKRIQSYLKNYFIITSNKLKDKSEVNSVSYQLSELYVDLIIFARHLFYGDIYEQANKRIPNKEIVGFSIIALTEMLVHAKIEDKHNTVTGTLTESLTLLTKVYKGTSEFLSNPPTDISSKKENSIAIINELTISYFFKLVIDYNNILNDLLLPPEVFKLAKWCTDMALEQQREQKFTTDILQ